MFCDVTGSTVLGEKLNPESLRRVISRNIEAMREALERHASFVFIAPKMAPRERPAVAQIRAAV